MSVVVRRPRALAIGDPGRAFLDDVVEGLLAEPKRLPPKYFYDQIGSELFQRITVLPEYYLTRTEIGILEARAGEIAKLIPANAAVVEFGAGSSVKTRILLRAAPHISAYVPVDISGAFLAAETARLQQEMPDLRVLPVEADITKPFMLPADLGDLLEVGLGRNDRAARPHHWFGEERGDGIRALGDNQRLECVRHPRQSSGLPCAHAPVAQWTERRTSNPRVGGSNPPGRMKSLQIDHFASKLPLSDRRESA